MLTGSVEVKLLAQDKVKLLFAGRLDVDSVARLWPEAFAVLSSQKPIDLNIDCANVDYCDGSGLALLKSLYQEQLRNSRKCTITNLNQQFNQLLEYIEQGPDKVLVNILPITRVTENLGKIALGVVYLVRENIIFLGQLFLQLVYFFRFPRKIRLSDFLRVLQDTGPNAIPIIALIGFLIGLISTFQAAPSFAEFGVQIYMVDLVALGLVREMGPLLTSVLLAGRTASSFAAEIGTMKINQEIDALKTFGLDSVRFLVIPKVLATIIVTPILEVFFIIFGLLGSLIVMLTLGYTVDAFFNRLYVAVLPLDYVGGLIKVFVFGMVIASVGCLHGIKTAYGAKAVGRSTTQAVVSSLIMLVVVDGIFASVYYVLGV